MKVFNFIFFFFCKVCKSQIKSKTKFIFFLSFDPEFRKKMMYSDLLEIINFDFTMSS